MGFFEKVGRRTEQLKNRMTDAAAEGAMYECANCGTELFTEPDACPECGSDAIVERVDEGTGAQARDETDEEAETTEVDNGDETDEEAETTEVDDGDETDKEGESVEKGESVESDDGGRTDDENGSVETGEAAGTSEN